MSKENEVVLKHRYGSDLEARDEVRIDFEADPQNYFTLHFKKFWYYFNANGELTDVTDVEKTTC